MSTTIEIQGLHFRPMFSPEEIAQRVHDLGREISDAYRGRELLMMPILKGSFMLSADLARAMDIPLTFRFVTLSTYGDGLESSQKVHEIRGIKGFDLKDKHVLVVEDIVDTGFSIGYLRKVIKAAGAASVQVVTLLYKPDAFKGKHQPEFIGFTIPNAFVVGYGMDYAQHGRELPGIYVKEG